MLAGNSYFWYRRKTIEERTMQSVRYAIWCCAVLVFTTTVFAQEYSTGPLLSPAEATARLTPEGARQTEA